MTSTRKKTYCAWMALLVATACTAHRPDHDWTHMFDGESLGAWTKTNFGGQGEIFIQDEKIWLDPGSPLTGVHWTGDFPTQNYELEVEAARIDGSDFFCGLTFPVGDQHLTLVLGGWGGSLVGISCLDGKDASDNATMRVMHFEDGRSYRVTLRVSQDRVHIALDGATIVDVDPRRHELSLRPEVVPSRPLGVCCFATTATLSAARWRKL